MFNFKNKKNKNLGFTIAELIVVIVVIGILASVTIVGYGSWKSSTLAAAVKSDLNGVVSAMEDYRNFNDGYPSTIPTTFTPSNDVSLTFFTGGTGSFYCVDGTSTKNASIQFYVSSSTKDKGALAGKCASVTYTLTIISGANGTVNTSVNGAYSPGSTPAITATPNANYLFSSWTGDSGCSGAISHTVTMNDNKTCTANFIVDPWANWYPGIAATILSGKHIYKTDLTPTYQYKTTSTYVTSPQGAIGLDPNYPSYMVLVSPQKYPIIDFSSYPAQNACKAIGGRLPNTQELYAIYAGRTTYNVNPSTFLYWSSTEYTVSWAYVLVATGSTGSTSGDGKTNLRNVRCVSD